MATTLITGCDYGIGFEFARQYAADGWQVHAVCLDPASRDKIGALDGNVHFHPLDVADQSAVTALAGQLEVPVTIFQETPLVQAVEHADAELAG